MSALAWSLVVVWALVLLAALRPVLKRLPGPLASVPEYGLWLPDLGAVPSLDPPPVVVHASPTPPTEGPERWLVLAGGVQVSPDLPGRLAACLADLVSVAPIPRGGPLGRARERLLRDLTEPQKVVDPRQSAGFADHRCAWLRRRDLALPAPGQPGPLRAARARKAHGLAVDLRDGRGPSNPARKLTGDVLVRSPALSAGELRRRFDELVGGDGVVRALLSGAPMLLCIAPLALLFHAEAWPIAALAVGLGTAARLAQAARDGFGLTGAVTGWLAEPALALELLGAPRGPHAPMPAAPEGPAPGLVAPRNVSDNRWLEGAAVPFLARRIGGSAAVMEQLYRNQPAGRSALGRAIDRAIQASPGARALRHRLYVTQELGRGLAPRRLLSVPGGSGRDAAAIDAPETVLVDPDPGARALAAELCPRALRVAGTVDEAPPGPFDLILFVGLIEYLDDTEARRLLVALRGRLHPEGALITSTTADYPDRERMRRWFGWQTRPRGPEALVDLLDAAGFRVESRHVDAGGIQWVMLARPRPILPPQRSPNA